MNNVKNALTRKIGPLPAWGWLVLIGAALFFYRSRSGGASSAQDQAQADAANPAYYGPYGQDNYPIDGGAGTGGGSGSSGAATGTTAPTAPPTINVNYSPPGSAGGGAANTGRGRRDAKPKAQHQGKYRTAKTPANDKPRVPATTHNGRQHPHGSGPYRSTPARRHTSGGAGTAKPKRVRKKR